MKIDISQKKNNKEYKLKKNDCYINLNTSEAYFVLAKNLIELNNLIDTLIAKRESIDTEDSHVMLLLNNGDIEWDYSSSIEDDFYSFYVEGKVVPEDENK